MKTLPKLTSLTIFFPFLNDAGTVARQVMVAHEIGRQLTDNLEIIAIHGGNSTDNTAEEIARMKGLYPELVVIDKRDNKEGYAVIKYGLLRATKEWVFYTDGDAQYHLEEDLPKLVAKQTQTRADVVNGYKKHRGDSFIRTFLGNVYKLISSKLFCLPIRDTDCDFRLIRKSFLGKIELESHCASILPELVKKLEKAGAKFSEVKVMHYRRVYGKSSYTALSLLKEKVLGDVDMYIKMKKEKLL
jgi:glycosyltransferase involved in cell wall biosynthesis